MRRHLQQGLGNKKITFFPHRKLFCKNKPVLKVTGILIFCTWHMPEHGFMFTCTECKNGSILAINLSTKLDAKFGRQI